MAISCHSSSIHEVSALPRDKEGDILEVELAPPPCLGGDMLEVIAELKACHEALALDGYSNIRIVSEEIPPEDPYNDINTYVFVTVRAERPMSQLECEKWEHWRKRWYNKEEE